MDPPALSPEPTGWSQNEKEPIFKAQADKEETANSQQIRAEPLRVRPQGALANCPDPARDAVRAAKEHSGSQLQGPGRPSGQCPLWLGQLVLRPIGAHP